MRCFYCLIGFVFFFTFWVRNVPQDKVKSIISEFTEVACFEQGSNLPFFAIETSVSSFSISSKDQQNFQVKRNLVQKQRLALLLDKLYNPINTQSCYFLSKSTSLFSLYHSSQPLLCVFRS